MHSVVRKRLPKRCNQRKMYDFWHLFSLCQGRLAYPGRIITVYGRGTLNSCGPTRLDRNKEYLLYGKMFVSNIKIQILWQNNNTLTIFFFTSTFG